MKKRMLWREQRRTLVKSRGRFLSIMALLFLGSFALVGLKVSGPLLQENADAYRNELQVMDLAVLADYGLSLADRQELDEWNQAARVEYGYLTDVVIEDTALALRIFSKPEEVSRFEVTEGRLPESVDEIAIASCMAAELKLGSVLEVTEKDEERQILKKHRFTVTGYVNSGELVSRDFLGSSNAGSGSLNGFAVVPAESFDSEYAGIARLRFAEWQSLSIFSDEYRQRIEEEREKLEAALADNGGVRQRELEAEAQAELDRRFEEEKEKALREAYAQAEKQAEEQVEAQIAAQIAAQNGFQSSVPAEAAAMVVPPELRAAMLEEAKQEARQTAKQKVEAEAVKPDPVKFEKPNYTVYTARTLPGGEGLVTIAVNTEGTSKVGDLFPVVLYLVAALVTMTTMTRFVNEERINAGVLAALGFSSKDIIQKFTRYGLAAGLTGTVLGILAGTFGLPLMIRETLLAGAALPLLRPHLFPGISIIALLCAWLCSVLPARIIAGRELHEVPAALLLPKPPAHGSRIFLERIGPLWRRMSFSAKVTARNLFRYKQRMLMTLFGVGGSVALLFAGLGIAASVESVSHGQFQEIVHYDVLVQNQDLAGKEKREQTEAEKELTALLQDPAVEEELPIYVEQLTKSVTGVVDLQDITLMVAGSNELEPMISLIADSEVTASDETDKMVSEREISGRGASKDGGHSGLPSQGALISEKLALLLGINSGDRIKVRRADGTQWQLPVAGVVRMYAGHYLLMSRSAFEDAFAQDWQANAHLLRTTDREAMAVRELAARFMELDAVKAVVQNTGIQEQIATVSASLHRVMVILVAASVVLAAVILYNLTAINVAERLRELSTVKVLGFYDREVTRYIFRETVILSLIGIVLGWLGGSILHRFLLQMVAPDHILFPAEVSWRIYLWPALVITLIVAACGLLVHIRLKRVDMLEALKSVD